MFFVSKIPQDELHEDLFSNSNLKFIKWIRILMWQAISIKNSCLKWTDDDIVGIFFVTIPCTQIEHLDSIIDSISQHINRTQKRLSQFVRRKLSKSKQKLLPNRFFLSFNCESFQISAFQHFSLPFTSNSVQTLFFVSLNCHLLREILPIPWRLLL